MYVYVYIYMYVYIYIYIHMIYIYIYIYIDDNLVSWFASAYSTSHNIVFLAKSTVVERYKSAIV